MASENKFQNRLIKEKSPYLLQHADNPVDWYPWGEEAFEQARSQDKPVFLSIGYSTCHWCHVMEHESFENLQIAGLINQYFIPVKVDREERPDIDNVYMSAVMAMTGQGGWPLTVLLTPEKKPFFGGTYFPPQTKWGSPGLVDLIQSVQHAWANRRDELLQSSQSITEILSEQAAAHAKTSSLDAQVFRSAFNQFRENYDGQYGGFGREPKFPSSHNLSFLLRYWKRYHDSQALAMVEQTLQGMSRGGMYDHIGGGFHRYATDQRWQIPHFEKMLYDQAMLVRTYLEAYQITKNEYYAQIARETLDYVLREMQSDSGGFYSAQDADSLDPDEPAENGAGVLPFPIKKEGAFYLWREEELVNLLGEESAQIFNHYFGIQKDGNAHSDPHGEFIGKNIIYVNATVEETAQYFDRPIEAIQRIVAESKNKLYQVRQKRPKPHLDDKVLTDWNGLMIASLAYGARVLNEPRYLEAAERSAQFILSDMRYDNGLLAHRYRDGESAIDGTIEDYAFFVHGLLDLYEASFNLEYLRHSLTLANVMIEQFWDLQEGGFYFTANDSEPLLFRQKEIYDGAIPSGNSMAAHNLIRLTRMTLDSKWEDTYSSLFEVFGASVIRRPISHAQMLIALDFAVGPSLEIIFAVPDHYTGIDGLVQIVYDRFLPNKIILLRSEKNGKAGDLAAIAPFSKAQLPTDGKPTVYVCEHHVCKRPVHTSEELAELLDKKRTEKTNHD